MLAPTEPGATRPLRLDRGRCELVRRQLLIEISCQTLECRRLLKEMTEFHSNAKRPIDGKTDLSQEERLEAEIEERRVRVER